MQSIRFTIIAILAGLPMLLTTPSHASDSAQAASSAQSGPATVIVGPPKAVGYTQPICSKCRRVKVETQTTAAGDTEAILELTYYDEVYTDFEGTIKLSVIISGNVEDVQIIDDVDLIEGEEAEWLLDNDLLWDWSEVDTVWVEFQPAQ